MKNPIKPSRLVNIVRTVARKSSTRLKFCWLNLICCICQSNELQRGIKHKTRGQVGGQPKIWEGYGLPRPPLKPPLLWWASPLQTKPQALKLKYEILQISGDCKQISISSLPAQT